jgi:hypothetical protein
VEQVNNDWVEFNGELPECGNYRVKINSHLIDGFVSVINTYVRDNEDDVIHGFVVSTMTEEDEDRAECSGWIERDMFYPIEGVTHYKKAELSDYVNDMPILRRLNGEFKICISPSTLN